MKVYNVVRVVNSSSEGLFVSVESYDDLEKAKKDLLESYKFDKECEDGEVGVESNLSDNGMKYWIEVRDEFGLSSVDCEIFEKEVK